MKHLAFVLLGILFGLPIYSQDCEVLLEAIHGKYTGDCKKNKADGTGKSEGTDTYQGEFKSGLPSGNGTYTYTNGDYYKGTFKKGLKEGKGEFHYKESDSTVTGFWKEDKFVGAYLSPYEIIQKTVGVNRVNVRVDVGRPNMITITSQNLIKSNRLADNQPPPLPVIGFFDVSQGSFEREEKSNTAKISVLVIYGVKFPFGAQFFYGEDNFELLISKEGTWNVEVDVSKRTD